MCRYLILCCRWVLVVLVVLGVGSIGGTVVAQQSADIVGADKREHGDVATGLEVHVEGNQVLLDSVLLWVMDLPEEGPATPKIAERAERRLRSFFQRTGYDLARVKAVIEGDALYVFVDEGRLDKIFLTGSGSAQALRFQLDLRLPGDVYNRHRIEEELARLEKKYNLRQLSAQLIVLDPSPTTFIQLQDFLTSLRADDGAEEVFRESRGRYALRVHLDSKEWGDGLSYGARYLLPYGLQTYASYASTGLAVEDDRYRISAEIAGLSDELLTHSQGRIYWAAPPFDDDWLRPAIDLRGRLDSVARHSLGLDDYLELELSGVGNVGIEPVRNLVFSLGMGYGYEKIFAVERTAETPDYVTEITRHYPLGRVGLSWLLGVRGFRRDKNHKLELEFELYNVDQGMVRRAKLDYVDVWEFGYQDLFWRVAGTTINGSGVQWQDEEPIASPILRSVAGDESFARNMGQMGLEFRMSLMRDILKVSLSGGGAIAGLVDRDEREQFIEFFASGGPGIHVLFLDNFQANGYYSFGWREGAPLEGRLSFSVMKVF